MSVKDAIIMRRSIRNYKKEDVADELIYDLLDCARLAPSACNSQPWRFKIVKDEKTKELLSQVSFNQKHIKEAPVVLVCCANIPDYVTGSINGCGELHSLDMIKKDFFELIINRSTSLKNVESEALSAEVSFNVAMSIEHIALRAVELGLGTCWVKLANPEKISQIFNWDKNISFVSLLTLGYPDEEPKPIKKLTLEEILL